MLIQSSELFAHNWEGFCLKEDGWIVPLFLEPKDETVPNDGKGVWHSWGVPNQIIDDVLGELELEGLEPTVVPPEVDDEGKEK